MSALGPFLTADLVRRLGPPVAEPKDYAIVYRREGAQEQCSGAVSLDDAIACLADLALFDNVVRAEIVPFVTLSKSRRAASEVMTPTSGGASSE